MELLLRFERYQGDIGIGISLLGLWRSHNDGLRVGRSGHQLAGSGFLGGVIVSHRYLRPRGQSGRPGGNVRRVGQEGGRRPVGGDEAVRQGN